MIGRCSAEDAEHSQTAAPSVEATPSPSEAAPSESGPSQTTQPAAPTASPTPSESAKPSQSAKPSKTAKPAKPAKPSNNAAVVLETLQVKGRAPKTGYDRTGAFGRAWLDTDRNGCRTRDDILTRDLRNTTREGRCKITSGVLNDPYSGRTINFERGPRTSQAVQIDHVVALSDAWQKGAQNLSQRERVLLANDPLNLLAVSGPLNQQKSDHDAASWLPPNKAYRCPMVARQIAVKSRYGLWVTQPEKEAMKRVLKSCPNQTIPVGGFAPKDAPMLPDSWVRD
ncbi:HNH endonuclease [Pseudoglutamicibacter cumminsii]|uniref:HNH endonuclease n=2 Tax=Pseudoglutamicibacter cumminsii TaxID=156979 RepID=A0ABX5L586_9MICC|nr:HNH endonuclease [Pseudoglutamicibacter cumminsii]